MPSNRAAGARWGWCATSPKTADIEELIGQTVSTYGGIDILVNNAGYTWDGMLHKMSDAQWLAMLDVHLTAPFKIIRAAVPYMREAAKRELDADKRARPRKIINISSTSGTRGNVGQANYSAAKAGIIGLTKTLAKEWGMFNIQVNAVAFGFIETRLTQSEAEGAFTEREGKRSNSAFLTTCASLPRCPSRWGAAAQWKRRLGRCSSSPASCRTTSAGRCLEVAGGM
jgi:3-oxoacyl-[acyl-carrier protein] reductase